MKKTISTTLILLLTAGLFAQPKYNLSFTEILHEDNNTSSEVQLLGLGIAGKGNVMGLWSHDDMSNSNFYKFRLDYDLLGVGPFKFGGSLQHVDGTNFSAHSESGFFVSISGNLMEKYFSKIDFRYFLETETFDGFVLVKAGDVSIDCLGSYNEDTESLMVKPTVSYNFNKKTSVGLESKFTGAPNKLKRKLGFKVKYNF